MKVNIKACCSWNPLKMIIIFLTFLLSVVKIFRLFPDSCYFAFCIVEGFKRDFVCVCAHTCPAWPRVQAYNKVKAASCSTNCQLLFIIFPVIMSTYLSRFSAYLFKTHYKFFFLRNFKIAWNGKLLNIRFVIEL